MRILALDVRSDEKNAFLEIEKRTHSEITLSDRHAVMETIPMVRGYEGISILGINPIGPELLDAWKAQGVKYLSTRTIGYNHIDLAYAEQIGIRVCNARYAPNGVADFTVMMMLMCLRNYKQALWRGQVNDFSLNGLIGREMRDLTIGVIGTGRIGYQVMRSLTGFGCRILAYDLYRNPAVKEIAEYVTLDELYKECDLITLHTPLLKSTYHMIDQEAISKMKTGVILINCARGELCDTEALIRGIETEKIGALGIDTMEGDEAIIHADHRTDILADRNWFYLHQFRNVIMTQHMAFYTEEAVYSMVESAIVGICRMGENLTCDTELHA